MTPTILITGAAGSLGTALTRELRGRDVSTVVTDIVWKDAWLDVTDAESVAAWVDETQPDVIFHLAGVKYPLEGEEDPAHVTAVNVDGTRNVLASGARVILSSTCKAANPETVYGATKLIAERLVLNAGGTVLRFFNVEETQGNVFRLWESLPAEEAIPWTDCVRYFVTLEQAVELCVKALDLPPGRYSPDPGDARHMVAVAVQHYPGRALIQVPRRRGDRERERLHSTSENVEHAEPGVLRVHCAHDALLVAEPVAA